MLLSAGAACKRRRRLAILAERPHPCLPGGREGRNQAIRLLVASILWGTTVGWISALITLLAEGYIQHGLRRLALEVTAGAVSSYLVVAVACWLVAAPVGFVLGRLAERIRPVRPRLGRVVWFAAGAMRLLLISLPVLAWSVWHDTWLYPRDPGLLLAGLGGLAVVLVVGYALLAGPVRARMTPARVRWANRAAGGCVLVVAGLLVAHLVAARHTRPDAPNIVLVIMDACRADRLGCYGYDKPTTPELDALAARGTVYSRCFATSCWTIPTHASLFTGLYPVRHGATQEHLKLARSFDTLAELLRNRGYQTFGASNNPIVSGFSWLDQGFGRFLEIWRGFYQRRYGKAGLHPTNQAVAEFLARADRDRPFFIFLNYMEAHSPYDPPEPFFSRCLTPGIDPRRARKIARTSWTKFYCEDSPFGPEELAIASDLYDGGVAHVSHVVGELVEVLRRSGRFERTLLIITADHGDSLGEHDRYEHQFNLHYTVLHVPLIVIDPDAPNRTGRPRVDGQTLQLPDLFASILDRAGIDPARVHCQGESIFARGSGPASRPAQERVIFAEYYFPLNAMSLFRPEDIAANRERLWPLMRRLRAIQVGGRKLIWASRGQQEFYDLVRDPQETRNLIDAPQQQDAVAALRAQLQELVRKYAEGRPIPPEPPVPASFEGMQGLDREARERLRSLGYVRGRKATTQPADQE